MVDRKNMEDFLLWLKEKRNCGSSTCNQRLGALKSFFSYLQFALPDKALECQKTLAIKPMKQSEPELKYLTIEGIKSFIRATRHKYKVWSQRSCLA